MSGDVAVYVVGRNFGDSWGSELEHDCGCLRLISLLYVCMKLWGDEEEEKRKGKWWTGNSGQFVFLRHQSLGAQGCGSQWEGSKRRLQAGTRGKTRGAELP